MATHSRGQILRTSLRGSSATEACHQQRVSPLQKPQVSKQEPSAELREKLLSHVYVYMHPLYSFYTLLYLFIRSLYFFPKLCGGFLFSHLGVSKGGHPLLMTRLRGGWAPKASFEDLTARMRRQYRIVAI